MPAPDAGAPVMLALLPCPGTPKLLWSRTFTDVEVDFRGAADESGNLYWIEYHPSSGYSFSPAFLVSADSGGHDRYRVPTPGGLIESLVVVSGKIVLSQDGIISAFDAGTGTPVWSLTLGANVEDHTQMADLGNGRIGVSRQGSDSIVDLEAGTVVSTSFASSGAVVGSDGAGSLLLGSSYSGVDGVVDSSGRSIWQQRVSGRFLGWSGIPWLAQTTDGSICSTTRYTAAPADWFDAAIGDDLGFFLSFGKPAIDALVVRGGAVRAMAHLEGTNSSSGISAFPFLAGDHLDLLFQNWRSNPGLCVPSVPLDASFARIDGSTIYRCPLALPEDSGIAGAALLPGKLVVGRFTLSTLACSKAIDPVTIEAYALPGESLSRSGWVQNGGSPGLGLRPR